MVQLVGSSQLAPVEDPSQDLVILVEEGFPGKKGDKGEQGDPGPPGAPGGSFFPYHQDPASSTWVVDHMLGRYVQPVVMLDSDPGNPQYCNVHHVDENHSLISFDSPESGWAYF